jgi:hypothetical protein
LAAGQPKVEDMLEFLLALGALALATRWLAMAAAQLGIPSVAVACLAALL